MDSAQHRSLRLPPPHVTVRTVVVPGLNDDAENLEETALFLGGLRGDFTLELLPYHKLGTGKYRQLPMRYALNDIEPPGAEEMTRIRAFFTSRNLHCIVNGK